MTTNYPEVPLGAILPFIGVNDNVPNGWSICDGREIDQIPENEDFINLYGDRAPDLRGRTMIGAGKPKNNQQKDGTTPDFREDDAWKVTEIGGQRDHILSIDEMPKHRHTINNGDFGTHKRSFKGEKDDDYPYETDPSETISGTDEAGGGKPHNNLPPYFVVNFIIKVATN